ncbi:MAG TPA: DinB family protein [Longimicrobium sp.]|nr:DinB family protein [Longimicrobium sp.]
MSDAPALLDDLLEAWRTSHRITLFLLDHVSDAGLRCTLSKRGGRDVARQLAHLHNVRVEHLRNRAKDLAEDLVSFETRDSPGRERLREALAASGERMERYFAELLAGAPKRKGLKKGVISTLSYYVAHEAHHRGSILLTLKECGHPVEQAARYAIWDWDRM